jgi:O-antigen/teichoic acid export membrane protein
MITELARGPTGTLPTRHHVIAAALLVQVVTVGGWALDAPFALRLPFGLVFMLFVPGFALVGLLRLSDAATELAASVAVSIALGIVTAQSLVWTGTYHPGVALYVLGTVSFVGLAVQFRDVPPGARFGTVSDNAVRDGASRAGAPGAAAGPMPVNGSVTGGGPAGPALPHGLSGDPRTSLFAGLDDWGRGLRRREAREPLPVPDPEPVWAADAARFPVDVETARPGLVAAVLAHVRVPMFRNAYALIGSTVLTTGLGMLGWIAAARLYSVDEVGRGQSAVNAMIVLAGLGNLRLMNVLTRFLPRARARSAWLVTRSYLLAAVASLVVCAGYFAIDDHIIPVSELVGGSVLAHGWFALAVVGFAIFTLQDAVLTGVRRATWVPVENGLHGLVKLAIVVACAASLPSTGIFASWVVPTLLALVPINIYIFRRLLPDNAALDIEAEDLSVRRLAPFTAAEYAGALCELAVVNVIPLVIAQQLGLAAAGVFGAAWLIGTTLDHVVVHFGSSLTAEAAAAPTELARLSRELLTRSAIVLVPIAAIVALGAPMILSLFGAEYADQAGGLLRLLGIALVPRLLCTVAVVLARVRGRVRAVVGIQAALAIGTLSGTFALLGGMGLVAPGIAYLVASTVVAAAVVPSLRRELAPRSVAW